MKARHNIRPRATPWVNRFGGCDVNDGRPVRVATDAPTPDRRDGGRPCPPGRRPGGAMPAAGRRRPPPRPTRSRRPSTSSRSSAPRCRSTCRSATSPTTGITLRDCLIPGKPVVLVLAYYRCPMLCNKVLTGLLDVMRLPPYTAGTDFNGRDRQLRPEGARRRGHPDQEDVRRRVRPAGGRAGVAVPDRPGSVRSPSSPTPSGSRYEFDKVFKEYNHPTRDRRS